MKTLEMNEMEVIEGGMTCSGFMDVLGWLSDNGHYEQLLIVQQSWGQYCEYQ